MPNTRAEPRHEALVGRAEEQRSLVALLDRAAGGRGGAALVRGDAGMGKTALVDEIGLLAETLGFTVVRGRAWEFAEAPPYFPLWPCLRSLGFEGDEGSTDGFHFWERVVAVLANAAALRRVVWIVEDVHAADEQTLELACFLAQAERAMPAALLLTARARDPRLSERGARILSRIARDGVLVELGPLSPDDILEIADRAAQSRLSAPDKARLVELAGGHPLFAVECAKSLRSTGARGVTIPATVRDVVLELVAALPRATNEALGAGAVLGREVSAYLVARMLEKLPARVIDDLGPALGAGVVSEASPGRFAFAHALTREAIYEALTPERRAELHRRAEAVLASVDDDRAHLVERAHHALSACRPGDEAHAVDLARRAAELADSQGAHDRAYALSRRAHLVSHPGASGMGGTAAELTELARSAHRAGLATEASALSRSAIERARAERDPVGLARAALALGAGLTPAVVDPSLVKALEAARAALGGSPADLACLVDARLAAALQPAADPKGPIELARGAVERAAATGDPAVLLEVLHFAGSAFVDFAPLHERIAIDERLVDVASSEGDPSRVLTGHARLLLDLAELGDIARFEETLARMREAALVVGHPRLTWRTSLLGSMSALARGDFAASERLVVEVEQLAPLADDHALSMSLAAHVQHRGRMTYREDLAADALRRVREQMRGVVFGPVLEALIEASTAAWFGDADAARRALSRVKLDVAAKREGILHRMAAEAVALVGTPEEAELLLGVAEPADGLMHVGGHVPMSVDGPVLRTRGLLHAARGDLGRAEEALSAALEISRARGLEPWVARIAFELARVHAAAGRAAEAESLFSDALLRARSLELPGLVALVERERLVGPGARSAVAPTKASAPPPVPAVRDFAMRREGDVWILSFEGRTPRVRDSRGLELLAELVARPQEELHVLALASDRGAPVGDSDAGPQLDQRAAVAYRARLQEIAGVLEQRSDEALVRERDFLEAELARAFGLRGERRAGSTSERARVNVQRRLKDAIRRIGEVDAGLGAYLERAVRTGTFCSFRP